MKKVMMSPVAVGLLLTATMAVAAGVERSLEKGIMVSDTNSITAIVEDIDHQARTVKLRGPHGALVEQKVDEKAKNFDKVQKGDTVTLEYYASLFLKLRKSEDVPTSSEASAVQRVPKGQKPKIVKVDTAEGVVAIEGVNATDRTITVRNPKGEVKTHSIGTKVKDFDRVKVGDSLYYSYSQVVVLEVKSPAPAPKKSGNK